MPYTYNRCRLSRGLTAGNMDIEQLFSELSRAKGATEKQELVNKALNSGIDQEQIREMLDYLECFGGEIQVTGKPSKDEKSR
jgi:hypothetical protein